MLSPPSKNKKPNGYKSMPKNKKRDKKSLSKSKRNKIKKILYKPSKIRLLKSKIKKYKKILCETKKEDEYYKPIKINDAFNDNYVEYQSNGNKDKILSIEEYRNMIKPYLSSIINYHKTKGEWKIQLSLKIILCLQKILKKHTLCMQIAIILIL